MQNQSRNNSALHNFYTRELITWLATRKAENYRPIIKGALPEVLTQHQNDSQIMESVLDKWSQALDNDPETISEISRLLKNGIWWSKNLWKMALGLVILLSAGGIGAITVTKVNNLSKNTPNCSLDIDCIALLERAIINDIDSPNFAEGNLTVSLTKGGTPDDLITIYHPGKDSGEIAVKGNQVTYRGSTIGNFKGGQGTEPLVVNFTEKATQETTQALLRNIIYQNLSESSNIGERTVEFKIDDGDGGTSKPLSKIVIVINASQAPIITLPGNQITKENTDLVFSGVKISDADSQKVNATLEVTKGTLTIKDNVAQGLQANNISGNKTKQVTLKGTIDQINTTLADPEAITYRGNKDFNGDESFTVTVNDGGKANKEKAKSGLIYPPNATNTKTTSNSISITVNPTNAPSIVNLPDAQSVDEDSQLSIGKIAIKDPDSQNVTVTLEVTNGTLTIKDDVPQGLRENNINNNKTKKVTLKGNIAQINTSLADPAAIVYQSDKDFDLTDSLTVTVNDGRNSDTKSTSITVNPINDAPILGIAKTPKTNPKPSPAPRNGSSRPSPSTPPPSYKSSSTNATIVGELGSKNIRTGPGLEYRKRHIAYPGDRVRVIEVRRNQDNFPWYHIYFPKSGADGWIAGHLLKVDGQTPYQPPSQPQSQAPPKAPSTRTNATVSGTPGTKNMRSGAGTAYGVVGTALTGDRVQILRSSYDRGNYQWYQVYHPKSGTKGWIAAHLINRD